MARSDGPTVEADRAESGPGLREHRVSWPSVQKETDGFAPRGSSDVIRKAACVGTPRAPSVLVFLKPMPLGAVFTPVWSLADQTWSRGLLRCLRAILLEVSLLSTVIAGPSLFTSGHFSQAV